jgi:hypothetical protein
VQPQHPVMTPVEARVCFAEDRCNDTSVMLNLLDLQVELGVIVCYVPKPWSNCARSQPFV